MTSPDEVFDILADVTPKNLSVFLNHLPASFYADAEEALSAIRGGRPFNVIHMPSVLKFDLFPASTFPLGREELDRAVLLEGTGLSEGPAWFVTKEDILLAKLHWFKLGGEVSAVQWRDIMGVVRACAATLDREYLERAASKLGVRSLLDRSLGEGAPTGANSQKKVTGIRANASGALPFCFIDLAYCI